MISQTTRPAVSNPVKSLDRPVTAAAVALLAVGLAIAAIAAFAPDGGVDLKAEQTPTIEDWRGNSASIRPVR